MAFSSGLRVFLREAALWTAVASIGFSGVYFYDDIRDMTARSLAASIPDSVALPPEPASNQASGSSGFERSVTLNASRNGHFYARAYINGQAIAVMVDTGATRIALTYKDAELLGLRPHNSDYTQRTRTANGFGRAAPVTLDSVRIGDVEVRDLHGSIAEEGKLHVTLLGMEFIRKLQRFELRGQELVLVE